MEIGFSQLIYILPEIVLIIGGLLILILDTMGGKRGGSGSGFMAISVLFLFVADVAAVLSMGAAAASTPFYVQLDPFASFLKVIVFTGMMLVALAGGGYLNKIISAQGEFWSAFIFVTVAMSFAVSANNLLLIFVAIEFLSITSYILVGFIRGDLRSTEAGLKYFLYGSVASAVMLYGMTILYGSASSLSLPEIGKWFAANKQLAGVVVPASILVMVGLGFKTSLAPFFQWTPDTYEGAPTPVAAYLSTASKAVGFAVIARIMLVALMPSAGVWIPLLGALSVLSMFAGNLMALRQKNVKRMLAYSSVAQAGYILLGLVAVVEPTAADVTKLSMNGLNGLLIYLFGYLFTNIGAFTVVLAVENLTGGSDYGHFRGLSKRSPWLAVAMLVFLLSLVGIPLTAGFIGKFFVFGATVQHQYFFLAVMAAINVAISAFYYLNLVRIMFFDGEAAEQVPNSSLGAGIGAQAIIALCVFFVIWIGVYPPNLIDWANTASRYLLTIL